MLTHLLKIFLDKISFEPKQYAQWTLFQSDAHQAQPEKETF